MLILRAVSLFFEIIYLLIIARCVGSFFIRPGDGVYRFYLGICSLTEPIMIPCRKLLDRIGLGRGMIDFSPVLAIILLGVIQSIIRSIVMNVVF